MLGIVGITHLTVHANAAAQDVDGVNTRGDPMTRPTPDAPTPPTTDRPRRTLRAGVSGVGALLGSDRACRRTAAVPRAFRR